MSIELEGYEHSGQVLAVILICTVLLRIICSKAKHLDDTTADKEILHKVGYKIEELELKVNILTYKMQYGSWPLPHQVHKSKFRKNLRNLRLTLSNPNERNEWIKQVLLSPRRNDSYSKYSYPSEQRLTELFDAKKSNFYPHLNRDNLSLEYSSRSSKSSSDKSTRLNTVFRKTIGQRQHKLSKSENLDLQNRNAISLPHFSRRRNSRFSSKRYKDKSFRDEKEACKRYMKTMADCKRYLKELHDSNKNLGLVCSSSEISDGSWVKNAWSETQHETDDYQRLPDNLSEKSEENEPDEPATEANTDNETNVKETDSDQQNKENRLELSNTIFPVLKVVDKPLLPSKMNITFCADMFPRQTVSNLLIQSPCERKSFIQSSEEALYQVKKKLESLHNVLRTYELRNSEARVTESQQESNNKINRICQNVMDTLVSATSEVNNCNEKKKSRINFDTVRKESDEMQQTVYNSSEQYDSDDTGRSSEVSIQKYSNMFAKHYLNELHCARSKINENRMYVLNNQDSNVVNDNEMIRSSTIVCNKIPERVYYTISSDLFENKDINGGAPIDDSMKSNIYTEHNRAKLSPDRQAIQMETEEDLLIVSPTSSRTEISKDSEYDEKSTALLLQEALQFKRALLTRIELERICHTDEESESTNSQSISEYGKYSYINNNLQSKLLDIISEEQSVSSSTEKTSRTYMYFNIKQDKQLARSSTYNTNMTSSVQQSEIENVQKSYMDSKDNLESTSEYFSLSNIIQERSNTNSNQLSSLKHRSLEENESIKIVPNDLQMKTLSHTMGNSDEKVTKMRLTNYLKNVDANMNQQEIRYDYINDREQFDKRLSQISNINEFINPNAVSVELFSQNLDETVDEEEQNTSVNEISNFLNPKYLEQCTNVSYSKHKEDASLDATLDLLDNEKYAEDNEMLIFSPNLTLRRHPGACSLIEQTLMATNTEKATEMHMLIENAGVYELSASESKENSIETNVIQDSLTSSMNNSNDSNIPEPPSVTMLTNKVMDEEELNLNWSNVQNNFSDNCINEKNTQTFSTDTITLRKYDSVDRENYCRQKAASNENVTLKEEYETINTHREDGKSEKVHSVTKTSFRDLSNEGPVNEAVYKSYSNLISPHSSLYFTDEASSSAVKLNTAQSKNSEGYLQPNLYTEKSNDQLYYQAAGSKDTGLASTSISNENKNIANITMINSQKSCSKVSGNQLNTEQELTNSNIRTNDKIDLASKNNAENADEFSINKIKEALKKENETLNKALYNNCNLLSSRSINNSHKTQSNFLICKTESLNVNQNVSSTSYQISPRNMKENITMRRANTTLKSRSQENTPKSEKLAKLNAAENTKELKSDLRNTIQSKREDSTISTHAKVRHLSVEPRRNTECNIKLDKKRSRSQISSRSNDSSKRFTSQSLEFPSNRDGQSSESKLKANSPAKSLLSTPRTSSKSCIPILKKRLEAARRTENEGRPKSPVRGPLTMTMFWRDNLPHKGPNVMEDTMKVEGNSETNEQCMEEGNSYAKRNDDQNHTNKDDLTKSSCFLRSPCENADNNVISQEPMVIYVNIFTKYDHNATKIVDPKRFLEYIKNRKLNVQKVIEEKQSNHKDETSMVSANQETSKMHKIVTIVSSVMNGNELHGTSVDLSGPKTNSESIINTLSSDQLKHLCFLSVEQREIDVTAKPSVIDTSTSISDLEHISGTSSVFSKFQICGTPKELNNDEYVTLLEILHQEANFAHLQELQHVCTKLVTERQKSK